MSTFRGIAVWYPHDRARSTADRPPSVREREPVPQKRTAGKVCVSSYHSSSPAVRFCSPAGGCSCHAVQGNSPAREFSLHAVQVNSPVGEFSLHAVQDNSPQGSLVYTRLRSIPQRGDFVSMPHHFV